MGGLSAIGFSLFPTVLVISAGATLGSLTTYYLSMGSEVIVEKFNKGGIGDRIHSWFAMHEWIGTSVVFLGALTPFPFDVVTFIAGFSKFPVKLYTVGCFIGKLEGSCLLWCSGMLCGHIYSNERNLSQQEGRPDYLLMCWGVPFLNTSQIFPARARSFSSRLRSLQVIPGHHQGY